MRALIVDDHDSNLRYLEALLDAEGWEVVAARNGAEALEAARRAPPDVVVSDLLMPVMDGYTLLRHWRADPALQRVPFVVFTATYTEPEDAALATRLGASAFILKPAEPDDLLAKVRAALAATPPPAVEPAPVEAGGTEVAELYNSALVRKLEEKTRQLEEAWHALERDAQRRHAADEALRAALRQQELLLESVAEGIHGLDVGGRIVFENAVAAAMFGWDRNQMIGQDAHALTHHHRADGSLFPPDRCPIYRTLKDGQVRRVEDEVFFRNDGTPFPVAYTCAPIRDETGKITGAVVSFRDVTAERAAEEQLAQQAALLRIAGQVARIGGWRIDLPERTLTWSDEIRAMHDLPPGTQASLIQGMEFFTPDSRPVMDQHLEACIRDGTPYDVEVEKVTATGRRIWVRNIGEAVRDADGRIVRVQGAFQDITAQKAADALLREQAALLDKAQDAIIVRDLDQRVRYWNKSAERLYGWTAAEVIGQQVAEMFYPTGEARAAFDAAVARVRETGEWVGELEQRTRDGRTVTVEGRWTLVRDDGGRPTSILAINTDITRRKTLEQQFIRAQRLESLGTLAGGIAHDLNNVLAPIIMSIDLLTSTAGDPETRETLDLIGTSARRGAELVRQVLSFARGLDSRRSALDPGRAVHDVVRIVTDTFPRNIRVVERLEDAVEQFLRDPGAGVGHGEAHVGARVGVEHQRRRLDVELDVVGGERHGAAGGHRVPRVDTEVEDDLVQLGRVGVHAAEGRVEPFHHPDVAREGVRDDADHVVDRAARVERRPPAVEPPGERQHL
ncbi:MAG TPA: PAS domain S-box protein, partial [Gemmatimonadales bacterium]|nr:PAS domain S-box protein [Gemmatimonadales bacterium]